MAEICLRQMVLYVRSHLHTKCVEKLIGAAVRLKTQLIRRIGRSWVERKPRIGMLVLERSAGRRVTGWIAVVVVCVVVIAPAYNSGVLAQRMQLTWLLYRQSERNEKLVQQSVSFDARKKNAQRFD